ncbi:MAG: hypothetical protein CMC83_02220 [Flavobacteriaceae bacterium]|nr:hypothetical protein [Flavobacteriaceae bacterium]
MPIKNQKIRQLAATIFLAALIFPYILNFLHSCEAHSHTECKEVKTHLHEKTNNCDTCDFNVHTYNFKVIEYFEPINHCYLKKIDLDSQSQLFNSLKQNNKKLRAPPIIS